MHGRCTWKYDLDVTRLHTIHVNAFIKKYDIYFILLFVSNLLFPRLLRARGSPGGRPRKRKRTLFRSPSSGISSPTRKHARIINRPSSADYTSDGDYEGDRQRKQFSIIKSNWCRGLA